jgi:alpha/beta superfamily hydrolase
VTPEALAFRSADGLRLEGAWDDAARERRAVVVICHPHPEMGGTMNAPLLLALRDDLVARGWAVLRFNFRGNGSSEGGFGMGTDEVADAQAAVATARDRAPGTPLALVGWSFGGAVAIRAAEMDDSLVGCAAVAPSVKAKAGVTAGLPPADDLDLGVPLLFVCGGNDNVVSPEDCKTWIDAVPAGRYVEISGANHFFWGRYDRLCSAVGDWLDDLV